MTKRMTLGSIYGGAAALFCLSLSPSASADLGGKGDFTISAERLFGFYSIDQERDIPGGGQANNDLGSSGFGFQQPVGLFDFARVGFDYFVINGLSIGGNLGFYSFDPDDDDVDEQDGLLFAPRVGYAVPFNRNWGIWPRGGLTYSSQDGFRNESQTALTLEIPFYFMPTANVGFTATPLFDIGLAGEYRAPGGSNQDYSETMFGLAFGMFAAF